MAEEKSALGFLLGAIICLVFIFSECFYQIGYKEGFASGYEKALNNNGLATITTVVTMDKIQK